MNKENRFEIATSYNNKKILNEIKYFLEKLVDGDEITFNQFTNILDKDNSLGLYNRKTLLDQRERFFKGKENKRSKRSSREIRMPLEDFVNFLDFIARNGRFDLGKLKKSIIYCIEAGLVVGK